MDLVGVKLAESIELIDGTMANCYVVTLGDKKILIDAGMKGSSKKIINYFTSARAKPDIVLITHSHTDHIGGLADIESEYHPQIYVPDKELEIVRGNSKMPSTGGFMSSLVGLSKSRPSSSAKPVSVLSFEGFQIVDTNGHTPGSTSYYFDDLKALFVGDSILEKAGKFDFNKSFTLDAKAADLSMKKILSMHGVTAYPGHGQRFIVP